MHEINSDTRVFLKTLPNWDRLSTKLENEYLNCYEIVVYFVGVVTRG